MSASYLLLLASFLFFSSITNAGDSCEQWYLSVIEPVLAQERAREGYTVVLAPNQRAAVGLAPQSPGFSPVSPLSARDQVFTWQGVFRRIRPGLKKAGYKNFKFLGEGGWAAVFSATDPSGRRVVIKAAKRNAPHIEAMLRSEHEALRELSKMEEGFPIKYFHRVPEDSATELTGKEGEEIPISITDFIPLYPSGDQPVRSLDTFSKAYFDEHPAHLESILRQIREAVVRLHHSPRGLLHRDLKAANVLTRFDASGNPRVILSDLGITAPTRGVPEHQKGNPIGSREGHVTGTLETMPQDQWKGLPSTAKTDLYSLRLMEWFLRAGRPNQKLRIPEDENIVVVNGLGRPSPQPARAWDDKDRSGRKLSPKERRIGMAEFSAWPSTMEERQELLEKAESGESDTEFFKYYAPKLRQMDAVAEIRKGKYPVRYNAAREYLNGTWLIEKLGTSADLFTIDRRETEAIIRGACLQFLEVEPYREFSSQAPWQPHHKLNFDGFFTKVKELHARYPTEIASLERYMKQAKEIYDAETRYH